MYPETRPCGVDDFFLSGSFRLGASLSQAKVANNNCVACAYPNQNVEIKIWKLGRKVVSEKETSCMLGR